MIAGGMMPADPGFAGTFSHSGKHRTHGAGEMSFLVPLRQAVAALAAAKKLVSADPLELRVIGTRKSGGESAVNFDISEISVGSF